MSLSRSTSMALALAALLHAVPASAQFGNLLNSLKGAVDALRQAAETPAAPAPAPAPAQPQAQPGPATAGDAPEQPQAAAPAPADVPAPAPAQAAAPAPGRPQPMTAERYCERITTYPAIVKLAAAMHEMGQPAVELKHTWLDNERGDLERAVAQKFQAVFMPGRPGMMSSEGQGMIVRAEEYVNACVASKARTPFLTLAGRFLDRRFNGWYEGEAEKAATDRNYKAIDIRGYSFGQALGRGRLSNTGPDPRVATLLVFLFPDYEELITKASPEPGSSFLAAAEERRQQVAKREAEQAREAAARKAEEDKAAAKAAQAKAYAESPEGQLVYAYQSFQVIQVCRDIRKGNAIQFVNEVDYNNFRGRMREIENRLKPGLKGKTTDQLWAEAENRNRKYDLTMGLGGDNPPTIDLIENLRSNNSGGRWTAAKQDCDFMVNRFQSHANDVLGKEAVRRNF
jgi:hypothetical protein